MAKGKKKSGQKQKRNQNTPKKGGSPAGTGPPQVPGPPPVHADREIPKWIAEDGDLYWRGRVILHLATQATSERALLDAFEDSGWESPILNPLPLEPLGDPTQARRNAVKNLNRHQDQIVFKSLHGGLMTWCPAERVQKK